MLAILASNGNRKPNIPNQLRKKAQGTIISCANWKAGLCIEGCLKDGVKPGTRCPYKTSLEATKCNCFNLNK